MRFTVRIVILLLALSITAIAQAPPTFTPASGPTLSPADAAKLQVLELRAENLGLKMAILRAEGEKIQAEHSQLLASLQKEGFELTRSPEGAWNYLVKPADKK